MKTIKTDILIIGAGPAGLSAAMELSRAGKDFMLIEKQPTPGGLARTYTFKEGEHTFYSDNGPHRFFSKNQYLYDFIEDLIDEDWIVVNRQTRQHIDGKFYDYPVNAAQALSNLGPWKSLRIGTDYGLAKIQYDLLGKKPTNFYEYTIANFGKTLGNFNMINYTEKIWGIPAREIHSDWAGQRIKGLSLGALMKDTAKRALGQGGSDKPKTLIDTFYYPSKGTGLIYDTIVKRITELGYKVVFNTQPTKVVHSKNKVTAVEVEGPDGKYIIECNHLVESVPMKQFLPLLSPTIPKEVAEANTKLRYRSQVYLFLTLDKESISTDQWIYFPSKETPMARISEMRNFSKTMSPEGKTSLFIEFFCFEGDDIWNMSTEELYDIAIEYFEKIGFFTRDEVRNKYVLREKNVYPVYDVHYKEYLAVLKKYMDGFENLYYIGRPGRFRYNNQDHSLEMGILAAKSLIDGVKYDIEKVGSETEYYESGNLAKSDKQATNVTSEELASQAKVTPKKTATKAKAAPKKAAAKPKAKAKPKA